ncbi:emerin (Emery-Dreifuss muscular dystrophy) [Clupea harengus]|uniref:Emerin (Emery-Dreifuss muscular dystrophy) n=1 Tax=Clupea harengus TaxID=7950 RepID=A0A6P3VHV0_CLUHA|nr:emerin (Emery-Dreifuss muscular dystrophy) [Clupea harengus]
MSDLSTKSEKEISDLLDEHGIKHGPIVGTTRALYEKKLKAAMAEGTPKQSPDKTYYREEEEEVEYIHYHPPVRDEGFGDVVRRPRNFENTHEVDHHFEEPVISRTQASYQNVSYSKLPPPKTSYQKPVTEAPKSGGVPGWLRLLVFVVIAVFLYYVYSTMEAEEENPFNRIEA